MSIRKTVDEKRQNLSDGEAVNRAQVCMFTTNSGAASYNTRPISPADTDNDDCLWFFSDMASNKNKEIMQQLDV